MEKANQFTSYGHHDKALNLLRTVLLVKRDTMAQLAIEQDPENDGPITAATTMISKAEDYLTMLKIYMVRRDIEQGLKLIEELDVLVKRITTEGLVPIDDGFIT